MFLLLLFLVFIAVSLFFGFRAFISKLPLIKFNKFNFMKVSIIEPYVGIVQALILANFSHKVTCIDNNKELLISSRMVFQIYMNLI